MTPAKAAPNDGTTSIAIPIPTARAPTPTWNPRENPLCLLERPSIILEAPIISNAIATNISISTAASVGYEIAIPAKMRINTPSPMLDHLDLPGKKIPAITRSIPTKNKIIASNQTTETNAAAGDTSTSMDSIIMIAPKPIWSIRTQVGLLFTYTLFTMLSILVFKY